MTGEEPLATGRAAQMTTSIRDARDQDRGAVVDLWRACDLTRPWNDPDADFCAALGYQPQAVTTWGRRLIEH